MATLVTRTTTQPDGTAAKGSELTHAEVDANFINLNTGKVEVSGAILFVAKAGEALTKGDVVYVSGVSGNEPVVSKADADDASKMPAFGLAETNANLNAAVNVVTFGTIYDLDTSGFTAGDTVYVSTTAGGLTATKPAGAASFIQNIGKVIRSHATAGSIKVGGAGRSNDTPNLNDGNVFIGNASNQTEARALVEADISDFGTYLTSYTETDTLDSVTGRGATTTNNVSVGQMTATNAVLEGTQDPILTLRSTDDGALYMEFERGADRHAYMGFGGSGDNFKIWNEESAGLIQFGTNNTEAIRIDENQDTTFYGKVELSNGASFTVGGSTENTDFLAGSSAGTSDDGTFAFYGGRAHNQGAGVVLYGDDHATAANEIRFLNGAFVERAKISADGTFVFQNGIEEQQYSLTGTVIDPANGTIQYKTLGANTTFTESLTDGEFVTLMIDDGSGLGFTVTWPTITWVGGSAPTLETTGYNVIELWQVNGVLYGAFVGAA